MKKTSLPARTLSKFGRWRLEVFPPEFRYSIILLFLAMFILAGWFAIYPTWGNDYRVEFVGMMFDIVFILALFSIFQFRDRRRQSIERQQELIEDFKRWDSEEAHFRLAGAIRRLNKLGTTKLNLIGARISDFDFSRHEIADISGSVFYDGSWGNPVAQGEVLLTRVKFDWIKCAAVQFSPYNPIEGLGNAGGGFAKFVDCTFENSDLSDAKFDGANLVWSDPPCDDIYDFEGEDEQGNPIIMQARYGAFDRANLRGASFKKAKLKNADFRNAENLKLANFEGARGLSSCVFDDDVIKDAVLQSAKPKSS